uniref:Uncharacterized protein n=1 Tax=Peronospora matthiolae TaxID=2874970 RepID=A0AAV1V4B1_9STRA
MYNPVGSSRERARQWIINAAASCCSMHKHDPIAPIHSFIHSFLSWWRTRRDLDCNTEQVLGFVLEETEGAITVEAAGSVHQVSVDISTCLSSSSSIDANSRAVIALSRLKAQSVIGTQKHLEPDSIEVKWALQLQSAMASA